MLAARYCTHHLALTGLHLALKAPVHHTLSCRGQCITPCAEGASASHLVLKQTINCLLILAFTLLIYMLQASLMMRTRCPMCAS